MKVACGRGKGSMVGAGDAFSMLFDLGRGHVPERLFAGDDADQRGGWSGWCHSEGYGRCGRGGAGRGARWAAGAPAASTATASTGLSTAAAGILLSATVSSAGRVSAAGLCAALSTTAGISVSAAAAASRLLASGPLVSVCATAVRLEAQNMAGSRNNKVHGLPAGVFLRGRG